MSVPTPEIGRFFIRLRKKLSIDFLFNELILMSTGAAAFRFVEWLPSLESKSFEFEVVASMLTA